MSVTERHFSVNGYSLAAREWHAGAAHKVIACHGWLDNAASFDVLAPLLPDCHIIAMDMPGHGLSDHKCLQATYNLWDDLGDILAVADEMGWESFKLLSHSRGAMMSLLLAAAIPERVETLVMLDGAWPLPVEAKDTAKQLRSHLLDRRRAPEKQLPSYASIDEAVANRCKAVGMSEEAARPIVLRGIKEQQGQFVWASDPRLTTASAMKLTKEHIVAITTALEVPALLLLADKGLGGMTDVVEKMRSFGQLQCELLEGSHHFHLEDKASLLAEKVKNFFA